MKTFVQYGAGNIGRGFIAQLFSEAGYFVHFIDVDPRVINALNTQKRYPVDIVSNSGNSEVWVENVDCLNGLETGNVADAIANCDLMATAVGVNVLPRIVPNIVAGFRKRIEIQNGKPLNIIICENLIDADKLLYKLMTELLNDEEIIAFNEKVGLVEASVGRMVPQMTEEQKKDNLLRVCVESFCELPVNKAAFKGGIPNISNLLPFAPFDYYIQRKLFIHNMSHAMTAYLGSILGCEFIWQAINNPVIKKITERAMTESAQALSKKFNIPLQSIKENIEDLLKRFGNVELGDTVQRVGKDTKRKLSANDRFSGAIKLCEEEGIVPAYIPIGIAAGLFFKCADDKGTEEVTQKLEKEGIEAVLREICELRGNNDYLKAYYHQLKSNTDLSIILSKAETYKLEQLKLNK